jgi:hypothetical protein
VEQYGVQVEILFLGCAVATATMIVLGAIPAATFLATLACSAGASSSDDDDEEESSSSLKRRAAGGAAGCAVATATIGACA